MVPFSEKYFQTTQTTGNQPLTLQITLKNQFPLKNNSRPSANFSPSFNPGASPPEPAPKIRLHLSPPAPHAGSRSARRTVARSAVPHAGPPQLPPAHRLPNQKQETKNSKPIPTSPIFTSAHVHKCRGFLPPSPGRALLPRRPCQSLRPTKPTPRAPTYSCRGRQSATIAVANQPPSSPLVARACYPGVIVGVHPTRPAPAPVAACRAASPLPRTATCPVPMGRGCPPRAGGRGPNAQQPT